MADSSSPDDQLSLIPARGDTGKEKLANWQLRLQQLEDFAKTATQIMLGYEPSRQRCVELHRLITGVEEQMLDSILKPINALPKERALKMLPACSAGCSHCCHQDVTVNIPEVIALYQWILETCDAETMARFRATAAQYALNFEPPKNGPRFNVPCPLLFEDKCSVYEFRPGICRGFTSLSAKRCEERRFNVGTSKVIVPVILPLRDIATILSKGIFLGLKGIGLKRYEVTLGLAMQIMFTDPGAPEKYLAGGDVFSSAQVESLIPL